MKKIMMMVLGVLIASGASAQTTLPTGTALRMKLETTLTTFSNHPGDPFQARLIDPVVLDGKTVVPAGSMVHGRVTKTSEPRRISGKPTIGIFPETLVLPNGDRFMLNAVLTDTNMGHGTDVNREGQFKGDGHDRKDQLEVGAGTGGGMLIGGLAGGPVGMLVGGSIGAGASATHWLVKHRTATLPAGAELWMELSRPLVMNANAPGQ